MPKKLETAVTQAQPDAASEHLQRIREAEKKVASIEILMVTIKENMKEAKARHKTARASLSTEIRDNNMRLPFVDKK